MKRIPLDALYLKFEARNVPGVTSDADAANAMGVSPGEMSQWLSGARKARISSLKRFAKELFFKHLVKRRPSEDYLAAEEEFLKAVDFLRRCERAELRIDAEPPARARTFLIQTNRLTETGEIVRHFGGEANDFPSGEQKSVASELAKERSSAARAEASMSSSPRLIRSMHRQVSPTDWIDCLISEILPEKLSKDEEGAWKDTAFSIFAPCQLPEAESVLNLMPNEENPFCFHKFSDPFQPVNQGLSGALVAQLVYSYRNDGYLSCFQRMNYSAMLIEISIYLTPLVRSVVREFVRMVFFRALYESEATVNPQMLQRIWHNLAEVGTERHLWGMRCAPVSSDKDRRVIDARLAQTQNCIAFASATKEGLPWWLELPTTTLQYEYALLLNAVLSHPHSTQKDAQSAVSNILDLEVDDADGRMFRASSLLNYVYRYPSDQDHCKEVVSEIQRLLMEPHAIQRSPVSVLGLSLIALQDRSLLTERVETFCEDDPHSAMQTAVSYKSFMLPSVRHEFLHLCSVGSGLFKFRDELHMPGEMLAARG